MVKVFLDESFKVFAEKEKLEERETLKIREGAGQQELMIKLNVAYDEIRRYWWTGKCSQTTKRYYFPTK